MVICASFRVVPMVLLEGVSMPLRVFRGGKLLVKLDLWFILEGQ